MEITPAQLEALTTRNIKLGLVDSGITKNALAKKAGISSTTFDRKLNTRPETFTLRELGQIASALGLRFEDLIKDAA